jgi:hypothetical protein
MKISLPTHSCYPQKLRFSQNILLNLNNKTFVNIRSWPITELFIDKCNIKTVMDDTFKDLQIHTGLDGGQSHCVLLASDSMIMVSRVRNIVTKLPIRDINITQLENCFQNLNLTGLDLSGIPLDSSTVVNFFNTKASCSSCLRFNDYGQ